MPRVPPDDNDIVVWRLNEGNSGPTYVNSSTSPNSMGTAMDLTAEVGTVIKDSLSLFDTDYCLQFPSFGTYPSGASGTNNRVETVGGTGVRVLAPLTVSGWVKVRSWNNLGDGYGYILKKAYRDELTWNSPFSTVDFVVWNSVNGALSFRVNVSGTLYQVLSDVRQGPVPQGPWSHIGLTFDRQVLKGYINGVLVGTTVLGTPGDLDFGTEGPWSFGALPGGANKQEGAVNVADWRIANTIRDLTYFQTIYRAGVLSW